MGSVTDIFSIFAKTAPDKGITGITAFLIEKVTQDFRAGKVEMGQILINNEDQEI